MGRSRWRLGAKRLLLFFFLLVTGSLLIVWLTLRASLARLDGEVSVAGLAADVSVARDAAGVPTLSGQSRDDVAYTLGYVHAQERFFQMDLLRRSAAGEMAALIGEAALAIDRSHRLHRFRAKAEASLPRLPDADRKLLQRYTAGVNAGMAALGSKPFEYWLLRTKPEPWQEADSLLVVYAMYFDLQGKQANREFARGWLADRTTPIERAFLLPESSTWDAPLDAHAIALPPGTPPPSAVPDAPPEWWRGKMTVARLVSPMSGDDMPGSNSWALAGGRTASGAAMLANDMHLGLRLPNTWYRAVLQFPDARGAPRRVVGVTLPGAPLVVAGSNGHVAWGFTNSYGDWLDLINLEPDPDDDQRYSTPEGMVPYETTLETLQVNHGEPEILRVRETRWGPVWRAGGELYAVHWVAHDGIRAVNLGLRRMELADDVPAALAAGKGAGLPAQNLLVADSAGHIAWSIAGPLPRRSWPGNHNTFPQFASDPHAAWRDYLGANEYPLAAPGANGQLWTANSRQLAGIAYSTIGDGGADLGARATQIRDDLSALQKADEKAMLAIALDDRALLMANWQKRLLALLDGEALKGHPQRAQALQLLKTWDGHAGAQSVAYRIARAWRDSIYLGLFGGIDAELGSAEAGVEYRDANPRWELVADALLTKQPPNWLPLGYADWSAFELARLDAALEDMTRDGQPLQRQTWGERNRASITHPFVRFMPWLKTVLGAPRDVLGGDNNMPRVQGPSFGASERMVITPGHEEQALFHMPGGQSGHPLSPFFLAGHEAWVQGAATPLLPGKTRYSLKFVAAK